MNKCKAEGCRNTRYLYDDLCISHKATGDQLTLNIFSNLSGRKVAEQDATGWGLDQVIRFACIQETMLDRNVQLKRIRKDGEE